METREKIERRENKKMIIENASSRNTARMKYKTNKTEAGDFR